MPDDTLYGAVKALYRDCSRPWATALALRTASCGVLMIDPTPRPGVEAAKPG